MITGRIEIQGRWTDLDESVCVRGCDADRLLKALGGCSCIAFLEEHESFGHVLLSRAEIRMCADEANRRLIGRIRKG